MRGALERVHAELSKLGFTMSLATVSRYMPTRPPDRGKQQRWMTFLRNHKNAITAMDFFVVPTVSFRLLYVWFVIDHGRRRIIHFNVTTSPTALWVSQQLREAFPDDSAPRYLIFDNDSIFSVDVSKSIRRLGITPKRTAFRSPWQNGTAERWVGTCKRELTDHVVVLGENHLRRLLRDYVGYYNADRVTRGFGIRRSVDPPSTDLHRRLDSSGNPESEACIIATSGTKRLDPTNSLRDDTPQDPTDE